MSQPERFTLADHGLLPDGEVDPDIVPSSKELEQIIMTIPLMPVSEEGCRSMLAAGFELGLEAAAKWLAENHSMRLGEIPNPFRDGPAKTTSGDALPEQNLYDTAPCFQCGSPRHRHDGFALGHCFESR